MAKRKRGQDFHVLNFYCDEGDCCALSAIMSGRRVHVMANSQKLDDTNSASVEYRKLVQKFKYQESNDSTSQTKSGSGEGDRDSGIDVTGNGDETPSRPEDDQPDDIEEELQSWMLAPLLASGDTSTPTKPCKRSETLQDWYKCGTEYYELDVAKNDGRLEAIELEPTSELEKEIENLLPTVMLPKYVSDKIVSPTYQASDLQVLDCSDQPPGTPYHPCRVKHTKSSRSYFLKIVDNSQPRTTKRELDVLNQVTKLELDKQMNVPVLEALVSFQDASKPASGQRNIMGFLQTDITDPTPLTHLLDPSVPQAKRDKWAEEADRMKAILHENKIVWGDAKADNFMVDENDELWIIDFGGSYTEGWVDPDLKETEAGDNMGTAKTVNALKDPVANTYNPEEEDQANEAGGRACETGRKRKAEEDAEGEEEEEEHPRKQIRGSG